DGPPDAHLTRVHARTVPTYDGVHDTTQALAITVTDTNDVAPTITSGTTASEAENTAANTVVYTATATDPDTNGTVSFSLSGTDAALFSINSTTGEVRFAAAPDHEAPADANHDNVYDLIVHANDGVHDTTQAVAITVTDVNEAPVITSNGGGDTAAVSVAENSTAVTTVTASDPDAGTTLTYSIAGGA